MNEFIKSFIDFIYANYKFIIAVILSVLGLLIFINVKEINLNVPKPSTKLVQSVTVETFSSSSNNNIDQNIDQNMGQQQDQPMGQQQQDQPKPQLMGGKTRKRRKYRKRQTKKVE